MLKQHNLLVFNLAADYNDTVLAFSTDWINAIAKDYNNVFLITMRSGKIATRENVKVYSIGKERGYSELRRAFIFYQLLFHLLRKHKVHACFSHMMPLFSVMAGPILKLLKIPHVLWYAHGTLNMKVKMAEKFVTAIVSSSEQGCRLSSDKVKVIGQAIETNKIEFKEFVQFDKKIKLLYVGRLAPVKGIHVLIDIMKQLKKEDDYFFELTIVGKALNDSDQSYLDKNIERIEELGLVNNISFAGHVDIEHIQSYYYENDILINPSNTGSMDKTVLEAMAAGMFVITGNEAYNTAEFKNAGGVYVDNEATAMTSKTLELVSLSQIDLKGRARDGSNWVRSMHSIDTISGRISNYFNL